MSDAIMMALDKIEQKIATVSEKAAAEMVDLGKVSTETKTAIETLGVEQRTLADRLLIIEQKAGAQEDAPAADETVGGQFTKHAAYDLFVKADGRVKTRVEVKNTVTNVIANTFSERRPNLVEGAFRVFTIEDLLTKIPTSANAIDWVRENVFVNAAAETAEGATKPQSSITFLPGTMPVSTIAHWIKITRQLAMDNAAMAAYTRGPRPSRRMPAMPPAIASSLRLWISIGLLRQQAAHPLRATRSAKMACSTRCGTCRAMPLCGLTATPSAHCQSASGHRSNR